MDKDRIIKQSFQVPFLYDVHFSRNIFHPENDLLKKLFEGKDTRIVLYVDDGLANAQPELQNRIKAYFLGWPNVHIDTVQGGEAVKNSLEGVEKVLRGVNEHHIDRHSYVIGVGGGAVLDMVGFAAAIAHRGVRHIRIPTTVLAQNDSGVGVKNGVNFFGKKNFIGTFAPPSVVINDVRFLRTLDERDWRSGISEAIKVALLKDPVFYSWIETNAEALNDHDEDAMEELIFRCAELHIRHISGYGDPFESGSSRPLDFGHWSAHRLEHLTDYSVRHGEAVAIGIALDVSYSAEIGLIPESLRDRILALFTRLGLPVYHPQLGGSHGLDEAVYSGLTEFREHLGGILTITLIDGIGHQVDVHEVNRNAFDKAGAYLAKRAK
jgi:3-dehydroquinate synthase